MKNIYILITALTFISCDLGDSYSGFVQDNDAKSEIVVKLADSYLAGIFDFAREYFTPDGKHLFNNLEFDVDGIIEGYNSHSLILKTSSITTERFIQDTLQMVLLKLFMILTGLQHL